jgi:hypothetical protein
MTMAPRHPAPPYRRLQAYAFDPSLTQQLDTALVNQATLKVPWEKDLGRGPAGEYVEVVDYDPASGCFYEPVDLNDPHLLAQDGLPPSEGSPQFHQQMVYAVSMRTIRNFEKALGRLALWRPLPGSGGKPDEFVPRLRIYPHALREANAFYSPEKRALLFGYFLATDSAGPGAPRGMVFTCLSHDIVAHETTHALLDGMHRRFTEATNPDVLAFHEAFADVVALFQHFSLPEALQHQIARTRGDLASQNLLGELAQQFGQATGHYRSLRSAIGRVDPRTGQPDPREYEDTLEPHDRGAILVAAVFDAFLAIYKARIADLLRIATNGTGVLSPGELHPDLVNRLADEAAKTAQHVLLICIRALDYCPPVDITFGEYLRALITADSDLVPDDSYGYRTAFCEAFRRRGIYPRDVRTLSVESLRWQEPETRQEEQMMLAFVKHLRTDTDVWRLSSSRKDVFRFMEDRRAELHGYLAKLGGKLPGVDLKQKFEVHSLRPSQRTDTGGQLSSQWIVEVTQKREGPVPGTPFRGGCTLVVDTDSGAVRYAIVKHIDSKTRFERQRQFLTDVSGRSLRATYFGLGADAAEPFALLHRDV